jgi:hypothetical protein
MSPMNLGSTPLLRACAFLLLALTPSFSLAQDPFEEIPKLLERIEGLETQMLASQERLLASRPLNERQEHAYVLLSNTYSNLDKIYSEFRALSTYKSLANLITEKLAMQYAMRTVVRQRDYLKKITKGQIELVEKALPTAGDQVTTRLLLEVRDLFRFSVELLDSLQVHEPKAR